jgi:hypothetical protein
MTISVSLLDAKGKKLIGPTFRSCIGFIADEDLINGHGDAHWMQLHLEKMQENAMRSYSVSRDVQDTYFKYVPEFLKWLRDGMFAGLLKDVLQENGDLLFDLNKHSYLTIQTITSIWRQPLRYPQRLCNMMFIYENGINGRKFNLDQAFLISTWYGALTLVDNKTVNIPFHSTSNNSGSEDFLSLYELNCSIEGLSKVIPEIFSNELFWSQPIIREVATYDDDDDDDDDDDERIGLRGSSTYMNRVLGQSKSKPFGAGRYTFAEILEV